MQVLLIYSQADVGLVNALCADLDRQSDINVTRHPLGTATRQSFSLPELITTHDAVVHLVSERFLTSLACMGEMIPLIKDDALRSIYREHTVPVLIAGSSDAVNIADTEGQLKIVDTWIEDAKKLEEALRQRTHVGTPLNELREELGTIREVAEHVLRFMRTITNHIHTTYYTSDSDAELQVLISHLHQMDPDQAGVSGNGRTPSAGESSSDQETLQRLHDGILVASEDDPSKPEFPPFSPRFPATPTVSLYVPQLNRTILVKDESRNLTGSHKDRMAWEIVVHYKKILNDLLEPSSSEPSIPTASIISNGSAAFAIQIMMRCYGLPDLKVLVDQNTDKNIVGKLQRAGCHVVIHDLSEKELHPSDVLELTENVGGLDFTSRDLVDPNRRTYYDWLAYEILNCGAKHIFIPVGTGDLFVNVLTVLRDELSGVKKDRRLEGGARTIEGVQLYGATSADWKTRMDKLWAAYRPTLDEARQLCTEVVEEGHCGSDSRIYEVDEQFVRSAVDAAHAGGIQCDESGMAGLALLGQLSQEEGFPPEEEILVVNTGWLAVP